MIKHYFQSPVYSILLSVCVTILCGTLLLALPVSRHESIAFIDLLFTATSATCVTGLLTIPLSSFTAFGKLVILTLIQMGGLGLITLTLFLFSFFADLSLATQFMAEKVLEVDSWKKGKKLLRFILLTTGIFELLGTAAIYASLNNNTYWSTQETSKKLFYAFFHAVSSFNNAGFTLFADGIKPFSDTMLFIIPTGILVFIGGFGFISLYELITYHRQTNKKILYLSLQTRIIISVTFFIIAISTLTFLLLEPYNLSQENNWVHSCIDAVFNAISSRNAGLTTFDIQSLSNATLFFILIIAFIGSAPGSSGSGIKVTSFAILLATIRAVIQGTLNIRIKEREIARDQVFKTFCIITLSMSWIVIMFFFLLILEDTMPFFALLFEVMSAFTTLGMSLGITAHLALLSKIIILTTMFIGRIGSVTLVLAISRSIKTDYHYPEERIMIS